MIATNGLGKMALWLRAILAISEDLGLVPSTNGDPMPSSGMWYVLTDEGTHTHTTFYLFIIKDGKEDFSPYNFRVHNLP